MQKLFRLTAMLLAAMLVVWVVGCGEEEELPPAIITEVSPQEGAEVAVNDTITVQFDNVPESVAINGNSAELTNNSAENYSELFRS